MSRLCHAHSATNFEESKTLVRAREAAQLLVARHDVEQLVTEVSKALNQVEQGWRKAIEKIAARASDQKIPMRGGTWGESVNFTQGTTR